MATVANMFAGAVTSVTLGGTDIGGTFDGVAISMESEHLDIKCDQVLGTLGKQLMDMKFIVTFGMAELTLQNLQLALQQLAGNYNSSSSSLKLSAVAQGSLTLVIVVPSPDSLSNRTYNFDLAYVVASGEHAYKKDAQTFQPVTCDCVANASTDVFGAISDAAI